MRNHILASVALVACLLSGVQAQAQVVGPSGATPLGSVAGPTGGAGANGSPANALQPGLASSCPNGTYTLTLPALGSTGLTLSGLANACAVTLAGGTSPQWQYWGLKVVQGTTGYPVTIANATCASSSNAAGCIIWSGGTPPTISTGAGITSVISFLTTDGDATINGGV